MNVETFAVADVKLLTPRRFADPRGFFVETWNQGRYTELGLPGPFVQDNFAVSIKAGTVRGLHMQIAPRMQGKLVHCVRGAIWDVAVDVRPGSSTYGQHAAAELTEENGAQLWIPEGFLHGYCTLKPDTAVIYKVTADYDRSAERGVIWNDPDLALPWPVAVDVAVLSDKDLILPQLRDFTV